MITVFNREKLMADTSSQELDRVTDILRKNAISYDVVTKKNMTTFGQIVHSNMSKTIGNGSPSASTYKDLVGDVLYTYLVYVRRKDFGAAKNVILIVFVKHTIAIVPTKAKPAKANNIAINTAIF